MTCDTAFIRIGRTAEEVFAFMADPERLSLWSFGTWRTRIDDSGLIQGTSIKDGATIFVRIDPHPAQLLIDYHVGPSPETLSPRIFVRVAPGDLFGDGCGSGLAMTVFRTTAMDETRWSSLIATHRVELELIKAALETGYDHRTV